MSFFLQIVIGCMLALVIVMGIAVLFSRHLLLRLLNETDRHNRTPLAIHLNEDPVAEWTESTPARQIIGEFTDLGFERGLTYQIPELNGVGILSLYRKKFVAVVYMTPTVGHFVAVLHEDHEGNCTTITNSPVGAEIDTPKNQTKIFQPHATVEQIVALIEARCGAIEGVAYNNSIFRERFESQYKDEQKYRNRNGGVSLDEVRRVVEVSGKNYSEEDIREAFLVQKQQELEQWNDAGLDEYFDDNNISAEARYNDGAYLIVPHKTDAAAFVHYLADADLVDESHVNKLAESVQSQTNIVKLFNTINEGRSPELRAEHKGRISFPVEAEVYRLAS